MEKKKYAYVTLLYLNKNKEATYLDGILLTGLGLRRQNTNYDLICLVTPDISNDIIKIIKIIYDKVVIIPYISPLNNEGIKILGDIFNPNDFKDDYNYSEMCKVFTKLHIFNSELLPYDKVCFVDSDLIPIKKFDDLFNLETPAGWLEMIDELHDYIENNKTLKHKYNSYSRTWGVWNNIKHNEIISKILTDVHKPPGSAINAGLLVIKPDSEIFNFFINQLQTPKNLWCKGSIDWGGNCVNFLINPEQDYLTQHFSGKWRMINGLYCAWANCNIKNIYGIHMAGNRVYINNKLIYGKTWQIQVMDYFSDFNKLTNLLMVWGIINYPELRNHVMKDLKIYIDSKFVKLNEIDKESIEYKSLSKEQKILFNYIKKIYSF